MKRTHNYFFFCVILLVAISSCADKLATEATTEAYEVEKDYSIPIESAISSLDEFLAENGMVQTKGGSEDYIQDYFAVSGDKDIESSFKTHSLYVVNFKENKGYALLSADRRIPEDIIAVIDGGNITEDAFDISEPILKPGKEDDLSVEKYREMAESGALAMMDIDPKLRDWINLTCLRYADWNMNNNRIDSDPYHGPHYRIVDTVSRLVGTAWGQVGPDGLFNKYSPLVGINHNLRAAAGCVSVALAQIVAYHEYPSIKFKDGEIDYKAIKKIHSYACPFYGGTPESREMLNKFIIYIGLLCKTQYFRIFDSSNGFAWPQGAASCLRCLGYDSVCLQNYSEEDILESLDKKCPVFMAGTDDTEKCGHAWVVDGYILRDYCPGGSSCNWTRQTLLHCNWGWHGQCNGYFTAGIFNPQDAKINDNLKVPHIGRNDSHSKDYNMNVKMITCRKPFPVMK